MIPIHWVILAFLFLSFFVFGKYARGLTGGPYAVPDGRISGPMIVICFAAGMALVGFICFWVGSGQEGF